MDRNILKKPIYKDFYVHVLKGVSMYACRARKLSAIDEAVDRFVAVALASMASSREVTINDVRDLLVRTLEMRERARELYEGACEPFPDQHEALSGPATMTVFADPRTIPAQARGLGARKLSGGRTRDDYYWEGVCLDKLSTLGAMAVSTKKGPCFEYDVYGFLHKVLNYLSRDLRAFELIALSDKMDKEGLKLANALASGDTWVDVPSPRARRTPVPDSPDLGGPMDSDPEPA